jgi:hypothetical protein
VRARAYRLSGGIRHPLRDGFTAYAALPGDEFVLSPSSADFAAPQPGRVRVSHRRLGTSNGCQDHTVLPYATTRLRQEASPGIASFVLRACQSLTRFNPPCDRICAPTLSRPPHPIPRS